MNDQDIIRKAVTLADGWFEFDEDRAENSDGFLFDLDSQILADALAAQLVRQVDAPYGVWQFPIGVCVSSTDVEDPRELSRVDGPDRTMNTLKAIVESKVLENE